MKYLVTGGSRGIGLSIARRLAAAGYGVTLCARNAELLNQRVAELPKIREDQAHDTWKLDMADLTAVADMKDCPHPPTEYTGFINCAGLAGAGLLATQSISGITKTLNVNLHAPILLSKHMVRGMVRSKNRLDEDQRRHLIFISSILGSRGQAGSTVYSATKAGIEGFTRSLAREIGSRGIAVNAVAPGLVETDMGVKADPQLMAANVFPGFVNPEAVADTVMFLLNSSTITGTTITVDNGCSV